MRKGYTSTKEHKRKDKTFIGPIWESVTVCGKAKNRVLAFRLQHRLERQMSTEVSEESIASIFRVAESTKQETRQHVPTTHHWASTVTQRIILIIVTAVTSALASIITQNRCKLSFLHVGENYVRLCILSIHVLNRSGKDNLKDAETKGTSP
jgi:hypothetical protein